MRNFLLATSAAIALVSTSLNAQAADLQPLPPPVYKAAAYLPPPVYNWTGFYIGGNLGAGWNSGNVSDSLFGLSYTASNTNTAVFLGGGQIGGNYQIGSWVLGVEADFDWAANNQNSGNTRVLPSGAPIQVSSNDRWITTLAGRLGYAADNWLFYGKAGGGWVGNSNFSVTNVTTGTSVAFSNNNTNSGWLAGGGIEWAFAHNWTAKLEYDYLGLNNTSYTLPATFPGLGADTFSTSGRNVQMLTVGINYLFH
jgi:outer membrane immunogenic protein